MSIGSLAGHIAAVPGAIARMGADDGRDVEQMRPPVQLATTAEIVAKFDQSVADALEIERLFTLARCAGALDLWAQCG